MSDYEERQEERRERYRERAERARAESKARSTNAHHLARVMNGQPILVGHHSEKRHRRDIDRMDRNIRASIDADSKAAHYDRKADGVGRAGISSDDPEAVVKLREKLAEMERSRDAMKRVNAAWRKAGRPKAPGLTDGLGTAAGPEDEAKWAKLGELVGEAEAARVLRTMSGDFLHRAPYTYALSNLGANVKRVRDRLEGLERRDEEPEAEPIEGAGFTIREDRDENRICFEFPGKPSAEVRQVLKSQGWRWNRRLVAWTRHLNNAGRASARYVAEKII